MSNSYSVAVEINSLVNSSTTYMTDWQQYGLPEFWEEARPGGFEDCDGYALSKRQRLLNAGWPLDKQMLCACMTETNEGHLVLAVETDQGWMVLDNRYPAPVDPLKVPYKWISSLRGNKWCALSWA